MSYATAADLAEYLFVEESALPADADRLLARASEEIYELVKNNYDETNDDHVEALTKAVCAQVEFYTNFSEMAVNNGNINSVSVGSTSINFDSSSKSGEKYILSTRARLYLNGQRLLYKGMTFGRRSEYYGEY